MSFRPSIPSRERTGCGYKNYFYRFAGWGKLYEELITVGEDILPTGHEKIMVLRSNYQPGEGKNLQESREILGNKIDELMKEALRHDSRTIKKIFKEIVPEYTPQENESVL